MKNCLLLDVLLVGFTSAVIAQSVTVNISSGYEVVVVPDSVSVPQVVNVAAVPQTVYVVLTPALVYHPHPYIRHFASIDEGMVIGHQIDDHYH